MRAGFRTTLVGFIQNGVGPALVARGLAEPRRARFLGLVPDDSFVLTVAGETQKAQLQGLIRKVSAVASLIDSDPVTVASLIAALGGTFLLVEQLKPHYPALEKALRAPTTRGDSDNFVNWEIFNTGGQGNACFDLGHLDFSCFDAGAFDSFDAGFSDAAGGDGGGGEGGSSGC